MNLHAQVNTALSQFSRYCCDRPEHSLTQCAQEAHLLQPCNQIRWLCRFSDLIAGRGEAATAKGLAAVLREGSPGLAEPLWDRLASLQVPVQFIAGQLDAKFVALAAKMAAATVRDMHRSTERVEISLSSSRDSTEIAGSALLPAQPGRSTDMTSGREEIVVEGCGHAVHIERPEALVPIIRSFAVRAEQAHIL